MRNLVKRLHCLFLCLAIVMAVVPRAFAGIEEDPEKVAACRASADTGNALTAAGQAMVAAGMPYLQQQVTVPIGMALIAAGMSMIAQGMWCLDQFAKAQAEKAAAEAAAKAAAEKAAAEKAAAEAAAQQHAQAEAKAAEQAEHTLERRLAVVFRFATFKDCVLGLGERSARANARPILPEGYTVESYCRRIFPHDVNAGKEATTMEMRFRFESLEQCVEATTVQMPQADGQVQFGQGQTAESYCLALFPQAEHEAEKKDEQKEKKKDEKKVDTQNSDLDSKDLHGAEVEIDMSTE